MTVPAPCTSGGTPPAGAAAASAGPMPPSTPLDIRLGLTQAAGVAHPLRWGIISASQIASDWVKCLQDVPGATVAAVAARDLGRAQEFAAAHGVSKAYGR